LPNRLQYFQTHQNLAMIAHESAFAIKATISNTMPGKHFTTIRALNYSTTYNGVAIWATHFGLGTAVRAGSDKGLGIWISSVDGVGIREESQNQSAANFATSIPTNKSDVVRIDAKGLGSGLSINVTIPSSAASGLNITHFQSDKNNHKRRNVIKTLSVSGLGTNISTLKGTTENDNIMWNKTKFTDLLGIQYPIVQGPFGGGLSSVELTTTVSDAGALGSFGMQPYGPEQIIETCLNIRKQTNKPFNINLWVNDRDARLAEFDNKDYQTLTEIFKPYFDELGLPIPERPQDLGAKYEDQLQAVFEVKPAVFSFVFGIPTENDLEKCRSLGIKTVGTATTVDEAIALEKTGDAVVATGMEAGGHRVSFLRSAEESLTGLFSLIPQVADAVNVPIIAAGGIADARGIKAALTLGADAVQIGTAFLATTQSNASQDHKDRLFAPDAKYTALTKVFTGRLSRGLKNRLTEELKEKGHLMAPYPLQGKFMGFLKAYPATSKSNPEFKSYWAGQSASLLKHKDAAILINSLVHEMEKM
jgi:nitronate monooxygenase